MKLIEKYSINNLNSKEEVFDYIISTLKQTICDYDFFVAWEKIFKNINNIEIRLNILNSIIGKEDIKARFKALIIDYPEVISVIPLLIATRAKIIKIATIEGIKIFDFHNFNNLSDDAINQIVDFTEKCGLLKLLEDKAIKNLVDYCIGIEVGLDTNARKNRSGEAMEKLIELYIKELCDKNNFKYLKQATVEDIKVKFNRVVPTDKASRHFDFVILTPQKLFILEVNYYAGGGSKLKAVAGEFKNLYELIDKNSDSCFIWITDGLGWLTAKKPLLEAFNVIDYILNIELIQKGLLEEIVKGQNND